jgi:glycerol kinase
MTGITRGTTDAHIARAALESIAYQTFDVLNAMNADSGIDIKELRVDGGATVNNRLMQFQADILQAKVVRPRITETTALGAAYLAGLAVGYWSGLKETGSQWEMDRTFEPELKPEDTETLIRGWHRAVKAAKVWAEDK